MIPHVMIQTFIFREKKHSSVSFKYVIRNHEFYKQIVKLNSLNYQRNEYVDIYLKIAMKLLLFPNPMLEHNDNA